MANTNIKSGEQAKGGTEWTTKPLTLTKRYWVTGTDDEVEVESTIKALAPDFFTYVTGQNVYRQSLAAVRTADTADGYAHWTGTVVYTPGAIPVQFDTTGTTQRVTQSIYTRSWYGDNPPNFNRGVGFDGDKFAGCDITVPSFTWTETYTMLMADLTWDKVMTMYQLTGKVNLDAFRGMASGEVLFLGASGGNQKNDLEADVSYKFVAQPNSTAISVPGVSDAIQKFGWDYLWVLYEDDVVTSNRRIKKPIAAYVEQVYQGANFSALGIG